MRSSLQPQTVKTTRPFSRTPDLNNVAVGVQPLPLSWLHVLGSFSDTIEFSHRVGFWTFGKELPFEFTSTTGLGIAQPVVRDRPGCRVAVLLLLLGWSRPASYSVAVTVRPAMALRSRSTMLLSCCYVGIGGVSMEEYVCRSSLVSMTDSMFLEAVG